MDIIFYAWPFNLWLFAYFPLQGERQILWRILAANLLYKIKIQCGRRKVYICFDSCLEIKWLHLEMCLLSHFLVPICLFLSMSQISSHISAQIPCPLESSSCLLITERWLSGLPDDIRFSICHSYWGYWTWTG